MGADAVCYNAVIKAYSSLPMGKPGFLEAFDIAERMQEDDIVPNIVTANLLLESAARDHRPDVLARAQKLFNEARENLTCWPNEFFFKAAIRACPSHRHELQQVWNQDARDPRFKEARPPLPQRNREGKQRRPINHPIRSR